METTIDSRPRLRSNGNSGRNFEKRPHPVMIFVNRFISAANGSPGFVCILVWLLVFTTLYMFSQGWIIRESRFCDQGSLIHVRKESILSAFAACIFAVSGFMNLSATLLQSAQKKRQCASFVFFIEVVACATNLCLFYKVFPDLKNVDGEAFDWLHLFQWSFTTPTMLVILSGLGTSMEEQLVMDWQLTSHAIMVDELLLVFGFLSMYNTGYLRALFYIAAVSCFLTLGHYICRIVNLCISNSGTASEVRAIGPRPPLASPPQAPKTHAAVPPLRQSEDGAAADGKNRL